jgi:5-formyltetrahydrofolate cyclo-ligase
MRSDELKRAKRDVRRRVLAVRDAMPPEDRAARGAAIVRRFLELPEVRAARTVMAFWSFGSEVATEPLLAALHGGGIACALPRIVQRRRLEVRTYAPGDPLTTTTFGAREPAEGDCVPPAAIDVICVPGVAFDRSGRRIGYGGGFYDAFLPATRDDARRAAIAFDVQVLDDELPAGAFDVRVDAIVTETRTIRCQGNR